MGGHVAEVEDKLLQVRPGRSQRPTYVDCADQPVRLTL